MRTQFRNALIKAALAGGTSVAALAASPASAQSVCVTTPLGVLDCAPATPTAEISLPGQTQAVTVTLPDSFDGTTTLDIDSTGPIELIADGAATIATAAGPALDLDSGADITARVTALSTAGDGATGALLTAVDDVVLVVDDTVTTAGDAADAINVTAGTANVTVGEARTVGVDSDGVEVVTLTGPGTVNADVIETLGSGSTDALVRSAGDITLNAGVLRSGGDQALGFDLQSDPGACAVVGAGSCDVNAVVGNVTTDGFGSIGGLVVAGGDTDITVGTLQTGGNEAAGLDLSADPTVCAALGTGGCGTAFTVENLTTDGARSPGAVVNAVGDINGDIGVLTTDGDDSAGLDLASDPAACIILGAGSCGTSFSVGQLTTNGDGSTGALVRGAGPTTANFGTADTFGDGATAVDIAGDPTACVVLGIGQCDTAVTAQRLSTAGQLAGGVLIDTPGRITTDIDTVTTEGDGSPAINLITDPTACATLGTGACSVVVGSTPGGAATGDPAGGTPGAPGGTDVDTDGQDSPGVVIATPGPVDGDLGNVDTDGDNSPGVVVDGGEGPIDVDFDAIDTDGANSPGVDIAGTGPINLGGGTVDTAGANSPGVLVVGDDGPVTIDVSAVATAGPDSDGIDASTGAGPITIAVGPVTVGGAGSNGIDATAASCGTVDVTARGAITSASGYGIDASSACAVRVRTLAGAPVRGALGGINAVSGVGTSITVGDELASSGGPALSVGGAAATVLIEPTGTLVGRFDLTDSNDTLVNAGTIDASGVSSFGDGTDALSNSGTIRAMGAPVSFTGLEIAANSGTLDMRDGATDDVLTLAGSYNGTGAATLGVDVGNGTASDRLVIAGVATGSTRVLVQGLNGGFAQGAVVVDAGAGTSADAFTYAGQSTGFADYQLVYQAAGNDFAIYGTPTTGAVGTALLARGARELFYRGNDAVAAQLGSGGTDENPRVSRALWVQATAQMQERDLALAASPFGLARTYDLDSRQEWYGAQGGLDLAGGPSSTFGITAGYTKSELDLQGTNLGIDYDAVNVGAYGRLRAGRLNVRGLIKYEFYWADVRDPIAGVSASSSGNGWGGWLEAGYRIGSPSFFFEPQASIEYSQVTFDDFDARGTSFAFDEANGLRGKAGVALGALVQQTARGRLTGYAKAQAIHEFEGEDGVSVANNGLTAAFALPRPETYGRGTLGMEFVGTNGTRAFFEGMLDVGEDVSGGGGRVGVSVRF